MEAKYNLKSPGVKRLMREALELAEPTEEYSASPLEDNLFEWHFTVRGPPSTEFQGGIYHGRILLPSQYPMKPPDIILLTPNGRFETNKKICLSISGHHPESWQPSWSIRTALLALIAFMPTKPGGTIGSLDYSAEERQILARKSQAWECHICGKINTKLSTNSATPLTQEESTLLQNISFKAEEDAAKVKVKEEPSVEQIENAPVDECEFQAVRQRISNTNTDIDETNTIDEDPLLRASVESTNRDKMWSTITWFIILAISALLMRRMIYFF